MNPNTPAFADGAVTSLTSAGISATFTAMLDPLHPPRTTATPRFVSHRREDGALRVERLTPENVAPDVARLLSVATGASKAARQRQGNMEWALLDGCRCVFRTDLAADPATGRPERRVTLTDIVAAPWNLARARDSCAAVPRERVTAVVAEAMHSPSRTTERKATPTPDQRVEATARCEEVVPSRAVAQEAATPILPVAPLAAVGETLSQPPSVALRVPARRVQEEGAVRIVARADGGFAGGSTDATPQDTAATATAVVAVPHSPVVQGPRPHGFWTVHGADPSALVQPTLSVCFVGDVTATPDAIHNPVLVDNTPPSLPTGARFAFELRGGLAVCGDGLYASVRIVDADEDCTPISSENGAPPAKMRMLHVGRTARAAPVLSSDKGSGETAAAEELRLPLDLAADHSSVARALYRIELFIYNVLPKKAQHMEVRFVVDVVAGAADPRTVLGRIAAKAVANGEAPPPRWARFVSREVILRSEAPCAEQANDATKPAADKRVEKNAATSQRDQKETPAVEKEPKTVRPKRAEEAEPVEARGRLPLQLKTTATSIAAMDPAASMDETSRQFWLRDCLTPSQHVGFGFVDPGRSNAPPQITHRQEHAPSTDAKKGRKSHSHIDSCYDNGSLLLREVIAVQATDEALARIVASAQRALHGTLDTFGRASSLLWLVVATMGGRDVSDGAETVLTEMRQAAASRKRMRPPPPCADTSDNDDGDESCSSQEEVDASERGDDESHLRRRFPLRRGDRGGRRRGPGAAARTATMAKPSVSANVVQLGSVRQGLCRHRALLLKILCDACGVPCFLVRGWHRAVAEPVATVAPKAVRRQSRRGTTKQEKQAVPTPPADDADAERERHTWNIVAIDGAFFLADAMLHPEGLRPWPDADYEYGGSGGALPLADTLGCTVVGGWPSSSGGADAAVAAVTPAATLVTIHELLGSGVAATVRRATLGAGFVAAIKQPHAAVEDCGNGKHAERNAGDQKTRAPSSTDLLSEDSVLLLRDEYHALRRFDGHPNIVRALGWFGGNSGKNTPAAAADLASRPGIILELCQTSLLGLMNQLLASGGSLSHAQQRDVVCGVLSGLAAMHAVGVAHCDIKAENVVINVARCDQCVPLGIICASCCFPEVKLADFADCRDVGTPLTGIVSCGVKVGTVPYAAPEVEARHVVGCASDLWSVGILCVEMANMELPEDTPRTRGRAGWLRVACPYRNPAAVVKTGATATTAPPPRRKAATVVIPSAVKPAEAPRWHAALCAMLLVPHHKERRSAAEALAMLTRNSHD